MWVSENQEEFYTTFVFLRNNDGQYKKSSGFWSKQALKLKNIRRTATAREECASANLTVDLFKRTQCVLTAAC